MAESVYFLCAVTSVLCCTLLFRAYARQRTRLLLWSALCFAGFALNNGLLFVDLVILPATIDLSLIRVFPSLAGCGVLIYGLIWDLT